MKKYFLLGLLAAALNLAAAENTVASAQQPVASEQKVAKQATPEQAAENGSEVAAETDSSCCGQCKGEKSETSAK